MEGIVRKICLVVIGMLTGFMLYADITETPTIVTSGITKCCYKCNREVLLKDILFKAILDIDSREIYLCYDCAAKYSIRPYGLMINATEDDGKPLFIPTVRHWIVPKEFSNEGR